MSYSSRRGGLLDYAVGETKERVVQNLAFSGVSIKDYADHKGADYKIYVMVAWNFADQIMEKMKHPDKIFIIPFPEFRVIRT